MKTTAQYSALIAVALIATFGLAACNKPNGQLSNSAAAEAPKESATLGAAIDDTGITAKVKGRISSDARTEGSDISVETNNGVVTLSGTAPKSSAKEAAEELARSTPDVKGVDNRIAAPTALDTFAAKTENAAERTGDAIGNAANKTGNAIEKAADNTGDAISDSYITTKVKGALIADERTKGTAIGVTTKDGHVSLSGSVASSAERESAVSIASGIKGVMHVDTAALKIASR